MILGNGVSSDDNPKRPGSMSDVDRALHSRESRRSPALGVPIVNAATIAQIEELNEIETNLAAEADEFDEQFTPVQDVLTLARTSQDQNLVFALWRHSANQELRFRRTRNRSAETKLRRDIDDNAKAITDIHGAAGTNGKLGELRRRVDGLSSKAWWLFTALVGALGAAAVKLVIVVRAFDSVEALATHNAQQIQLLQAQVMTLQTALITRYRPAEEPGKATFP